MRVAQQVEGGSESAAANDALACSFLLFSPHLITAADSAVSIEMGLRVHLVA